VGLPPRLCKAFRLITHAAVVCPPLDANVVMAPMAEQQATPFNWPVCGWLRSCRWKSGAIPVQLTSRSSRQLARSPPHFVRRARIARRLSLVVRSPREGTPESYYRRPVAAIVRRGTQFRAGLAVLLLSGAAVPLILSQGAGFFQDYDCAHPGPAPWPDSGLLQVRADNPSPSTGGDKVHLMRARYDAKNDTTLVLTSCNSYTGSPPCCVYYVWVHLKGNHTDLGWQEYFWIRIGPQSERLVVFEDGTNWTAEFGERVLMTTQVHQVVSPWPYWLGLAMALGGLASAGAVLGRAPWAIPAGLASGTVLGVLAAATAVPAGLAVFGGGILWIPLFAILGGLGVWKSKSVRGRAFWSLFATFFGGQIVGTILIMWKFGLAW
jgi:hypothetical protein